jgi:hypothetical protein
MKGIAKLTIGLAGGLALTAGVCAQDTPTAGDPYAVVVTRNIFGLNPPPPPGPPADATPAPKITPNGIMDIFGQLQVLFKVAGPAKPGVPAADQAYILSEGQRQDDIEVIKIDNKAGIVTFNNHGETQELPLVVTLPSSTPSAAPTGALGGGPGAGLGGRFGSGGPAGRQGGFGNGAGGGSASNAGNAGINGGSNDGTNLRNVPTRNNTFNAASQVPAGLTEEVQTIAIEAGRLNAQQNNDGTHVIFPITELTPNQESK